MLSSHLDLYSTNNIRIIFYTPSKVIDSGSVSESIVFSLIVISEELSLPWLKLLCIDI